jgi:hypothetical protein|tara:strand:- start:157 stop:354 length:198 start_codon:yes stop_codon:yes gene_type:complete
MNNRILLAFAVIVVAMWMVFRYQEKYQSGRADYRYGFVDTNPARRVSDAFDSPNIDNPYEGLPLP